MKLLPFIPEQASTLAVRFEYLFWYITIVCGVAGFLVYAFMVYCCVKYRRGATTGSTPRILGSHRLELAWTIIPTIIFFTFFGWGVAVFSHAPILPPTPRRSSSPASSGCGRLSTRTGPRSSSAATRGT